MNIKTAEPQITGLDYADPDGILTENRAPSFEPVEAHDEYESQPCPPEPAPESWIEERDRWFSILSKKYTRVMIGKKHRIAHEMKNEDGLLDVEFIEQKELEAKYQNIVIKIGEKTESESGLQRVRPKDIFCNVFKAWAKHPDNHDKAVIFKPTANVDSPQEDGVFNLWRGFGVEPIKASGIAEEGLQRIKNHIKDVVCAGDPVLSKYLLNWCFYTLKNPEKPAGAALVLVGEKGTGKTILGEFLMQIWGVHAEIIGNARHLTGHFNNHLSKACFLFSDEAFYSGDKAGENVLKHLVTGKKMTLEKKGFDAEKQKNYLKIMMCTNNKQAVPASKDERRYCVFNVSSARRGDDPYFDDLGAATNNKDVQAAFLYEALNCDLTGFRPSDIPESEGLKEQRYHSLCSIGKWLFECLKHGELRFKDKAVRTYWQTEISTSSLYESYDFYCFNLGLRKYDKADLTAFGLYLNDVGFQKWRTKKDGTMRDMRSLPDAIELFQQYEKVTIARDVVEDADVYGCTLEPILSDV